MVEENRNYPDDYPEEYQGSYPGDRTDYPADRLDEDRRQQERLRLQREEQRLAIARREEVVNRAVEIVYYLVGALLVLLLIRFFLRLSGANIENQFARFIYNFSEPFVSPFSTLFISPTFGRSIFDVNLLVAIIVYAILGWLVGRLIRLIWGVED